MSASPSVGRSFGREREGEAGFVVLRKLHLLGVRRRSPAMWKKEGLDRGRWDPPRQQGREQCSEANINAVS